MHRKPHSVSAADARTLRLASPAVTDDVMRAYLRYLETLTVRLERDGVDAQTIAAAREEAKTASGMDAMTATALASVVARFCAVARPRRRLEDTLAASERALTEAPSPELRERIEKIGSHLAQNAGRDELERLYGAEGAAVLYQYQDALLSWTERRDACEGRA